MLHLTRQEQRVLIAALLLVLSGLAVKAWRTANPPAPASAPGAAR